MASFDQLKKAILEIASDTPEDVADELARAIVALGDEGTKETRVLTVAEKR
jgi:hypothetical protein